MDTVAMVGRLLVSLAAVLGVMWLLARRARKGMKGKGTRVIEVIDRASLGRSSSVAVVRVNDQAFVLGVAESQVTILGETDLAAALATKDDAAPVRKRTAPSHQAPRVVVPKQQQQQPVPASPIAGSALSPQTWKQTIESLRDITARP